MYIRKAEKDLGFVTQKRRPVIGDAFSIMVPETRLELVRVAPHAPQTCVSTNSTTPAIRQTGGYCNFKAISTFGRRPARKIRAVGHLTTMSLKLQYPPVVSLKL